MTEAKEIEAKFKTFSVTPKKAKIPVDGTTAVIKISGTIQSTNKNKKVNITLTFPNGKVKHQQPAPYAETATSNIYNFEWMYGVAKGSEIGTYKVQTVLEENPSEKRSDTFEVS